MSLPRPNVLVWFGLLGAPAAWTLQFLFGYWLGEVGCSPGGDSGLAIDGWTLAATIAAALIALLAGLAALAVFRQTDEGRVHFLATVGMAIAPLFFFIIVMSGVGVAVLENCQQG
jgi:hypothetical protein